MKRSNGMADQKAHRFRMDGMAMALRIVEERGVEGLREEVKTRNAMFIPLEVTRKSVEDLNAFFGEQDIEYLPNRNAVYAQPEIRFRPEAADEIL